MRNKLDTNIFHVWSMWARRALPAASGDLKKNLHGCIMVVWFFLQQTLLRRHITIVERDPQKHIHVARSNLFFTSNWITKDGGKEKQSKEWVRTEHIFQSKVFLRMLLWLLKFEVYIYRHFLQIKKIKCLKAYTSFDFNACITIHLKYNKYTSEV